MESQEMLETTFSFHNTNGFDDLNISNSSCNGFESEKAAIGVENRDNVDVEFLDDLDTMMEDIDNRLKISRMVNESMIKGMVTAVEQDADEKIKAKELELANLKRSLQFPNSNGDQNEFKGYVNLEDAYMKHDKMKESSVSLKKSAADQFKRLRKQIEGARGCKIKRNGSCQEMVGLGGILKEKEYENSVGLEKTINNLEMTINNISRLVDSVLTSSKTSLTVWQKEQDLKREVEDMVMKTSIRCIQEELWEQKASHCESQHKAFTEKFSNISGLRNELEAFNKLIPSCESGNLVSHGSFDIDKSHGKPLRSQLSLPWVENGILSESKPEVPDSFGAAELSHLTRDNLVKFFNDMMSKIKRDHESKVQRITENYISLKGKYLSERSHIFLPNKELETLRRKIPEVVSKLNGILSESDEFIGNGDSVASIHALNDTLLRENHLLRDSIAVKKEEVKLLSSQLSAASSSRNFQKLEDACLEASIVEDVHKCVIRELNCQIQDMKDESELQMTAIQDIYEVLLGVANVGAKDATDCATEDTFMDSLFKSELLEIVFKEILADVSQKFENLHTEYITANELIISLEKKAMEMEVELKSEGEERERLKNEVGSLRKVVEEKEKSEIEFTKERKQYETLMLKVNTELTEMSEKLLKAEDKLLSEKQEINSLNKKLDLAKEEIKASIEHKNKIFSLSEEKQSFMSLIEVKEKEHRKQMEAIVVLVDELSTKFVDFERRITKNVVNNNTRLENSKYQLTSLIKSANVLKSSGLLYKQKLESKCHDLQMAEDEVDLLGDEVETLLGLLEKIYIALDHYSPVLQHYPGVIEILKLVRRELSGESLKTQ